MGTWPVQRKAGAPFLVVEKGLAGHEAVRAAGTQLKFNGKTACDIYIYIYAEMMLKQTEAKAALNAL